METQTTHIGVAESQNAEAPKQEPQEQAHQQEPSQEQQDNEKLQLVADGLFEQYNPGSELEDADVIIIAVALCKRRQHAEYTSETRALDQQISAALARLSQSKAIRGELPKQTIGIMSSVRRKNPDWGLVRRPVGTQMRAHPRCSREALQLWAPHGAGNNSSNAKTRGEDPLAASLRAWKKQARGEAYEPGEAE